jgi:AraC-like DNA-binding protein
MSSIILRKQHHYSDDFPFYINYTKDLKFEKLKLNSTLHWHPFYEIEFIDIGSAIHIFNETSYPIERGSAYLLTPVDFHTVRRTSSDTLIPVALYTLQFDETSLSSEIYNTLMALHPPIKVKFSEEEYSAIRPMLDELLDERKGDKFKSRLMIKYLFNCVILKLIRKYMDISNVGQPVLSGANDVIQKAVAYIRFNFKNPDLSVSSLACQFHLSPNYFGESFHKVMGMSSLAYIKKLRLEFARGLLLNSDLSVEKVAMECGFESTPYFIKEFKLTYNTPPLRFKEANIEKFGS